MTKVKILIQGMHCSSCANNIEKSLKKVPGVKSVSVSLITRKGLVELDENKKVKDEDLRKAVEKTGYKVVSIEK